MNVFQRFKSAFIGIALLLAAGLIMHLGEDAYIFVILGLAVAFIAKALKDIIFYFRMARHMVGGKMILFKGVIILDFALYTSSLMDASKLFMLLYLIVIYAFSGVIEILRAMEAKSTVDGPWKMKFCHGVINILIALSCLFFIRQMQIALIIYCIGLIYSAVIWIISAFRKTTFILIE